MQLQSSFHRVFSRAVKADYDFSLFHKHWLFLGAGSGGTAWEGLGLLRARYASWLS